jgi:hypothetical protein
METRKIIIVDSSSNNKVEVNTDATTFGELKRAARAAGISYEGKDWLEGLTKTTPMSDDSLLPTNVSYKGTVTNNLVYMLTNTNKKIKSGMDRKEIYSEVKRLGIADSIKSKYGKNFTQVSSADLEKEVKAIVNKNIKKNKAVSPIKNVAAPAKPKVVAVRKELDNKDCTEKYNKVIKGLAKFIGSLSEEVIKDMSEVAKTLTPETVVEEVNFSDVDLKELFNK